MKRIGLFLILIIFFFYLDQNFKVDDLEELRSEVVAKTETLPPNIFTTDSCSLWPNKFLNKDITNLCIEHDMLYWAGGNTQERKMADEILKESVNKVIYPVGSFMYLIVRVFGHPIIPVPWRWGYGYDYHY